MESVKQEPQPTAPKEDKFVPIMKDRSEEEEPETSPNRVVVKTNDWKLIGIALAVIAVMVTMIIVSLKIRVWLNSEDGYDFVKMEGGYKICGYSGKETILTLPDTFKDKPVIEVGERVFSTKEIKEVKIPKGIQIIGYGAFENCGELTKVEMADSVTSLGNNAFRGCGKLTSIRFSENIYRISRGAFGNCVSLKEIELPKNIEEIGNDAFEGCKNLKKVKASKKLKEIDYHAFADCSNLELIYNAGTPSIADSAFEGCPKVRVT